MENKLNTAIQYLLQAGILLNSLQGGQNAAKVVNSLVEGLENLDQKGEIG